MDNDVQFTAATWHSLDRDIKFAGGSEHPAKDRHPVALDSADPNPRAFRNVHDFVRFRTLGDLAQHVPASRKTATLKK